ncbi:hypothetical protein GCM10025859_35660 [Alicyclobacillus fastidiosus]|nr:hypothetical protein GCM10025859_35660 [Alicyclobacillus fastidiosus]
MSLKEEALKLHRLHVGKLAVAPKMSVENERDLSLAYSPGVAEPCKEIHRDEALSYEYTGKGNTIAIVTNGTAVLGLGNIGAAAALPVMEGKALLFKRFAGVDAFPICINSEDPDEVVRTVKLLESQFGGVNLEDIAAPACFDIERRLIEETNIPIFHDDQHGTAIVTAAALLNALKLAGKSVGSVRVVVNGAGAAGVATVDLLLAMGVQDIILCDTKGAIYRGRTEGMNAMKEAFALRTNAFERRGRSPTSSQTPMYSSACRVLGHLHRRWFTQWRAVLSCLRWPTQTRKFCQKWRWNTGFWWLGPGGLTTPTR